MRGGGSELHPGSSSTRPDPAQGRTRRGFLFAGKSSPPWRPGTERSAPSANFCTRSAHRASDLQARHLEVLYGQEASKKRSAPSCRRSGPSWQRPSRATWRETESPRPGSLSAAPGWSPFAKWMIRKYFNLGSSPSTARVSSGNVPITSCSSEVNREISLSVRYLQCHTRSTLTPVGSRVNGNEVTPSRTKSSCSPELSISPDLLDFFEPFIAGRRLGWEWAHCAAA